MGELHKKSPAAVRWRVVLDKLPGMRLYQVVFVMDYVQFGFDGETENVTLSAFNPTTVRVGTTSHSPGAPGHRDALCERIRRTVVAAETADEELRVVFDDGAVFAVSLRDQDRVGPEAVYISSGDGGQVF